MPRSDRRRFLILIAALAALALLVAPAQAQEGAAPDKPTGLNATATHGQVVLTWNDPGDASITGYVILRRNRKTTVEGQFSELAPHTGSAATTYTDASVTARTSYTYRIKAINEHGVSERSRWFHIDTPAAPERVQAARLPAKPRSLTAEVAHASVTLTWRDPQDDSITGYVILRRDKAIHQVGTFETVASDTGSAGATYTDGTVQPDKQYVYRIKAINAAGLSEISSWVRAYTPSVPLPAKPTGLTATPSHDRVVLTWNDPNDASITGYVILRRHREDDPKGQFSELVADTGSAATTYTDHTVAANTPYTYRIKAINEYGVSERSRWFHIDTPAAPQATFTEANGQDEQGGQDDPAGAPGHATPGGSGKKENGSEVGAADRANGPAQVTIVADQDVFTAQFDNVSFTLTRTGNTDAALTVSVTLTQDLELFTPEYLPRSVQFEADSSTAPLIVYPSMVSDHEVTQATTLTATVATGTGYTPGSPASASTRILVIDPAVTVRIEEATYRFDEHATGAATAVHVVARTASGVPSPNTVVLAALTLRDGTAVGRGVDYQSLSETVSFEPSDFTVDGQVFTARKAVQLELVDDTITEMDETIEVLLLYAPGSAGVIALRLSDGTTCPPNRCTSTVTIADNDTPRVTTPTVTSVVVASAPQSGNTYRWGETILFTVTFSEPVRVTGRPALEVGLDNAAGGAVQARFAGLTETQRPTVGTWPVPVSQHVHFTYTVQPSDRDADGIRIGVYALRLGSADRIRSGETGASAELAHAALGPQSGHRVDGQPTVRVARAGIRFVDTDGSLLETLADGSRRLWVPEGGSARYGLKLKSRPTHRVVVSHHYMYEGDPDLAVPRNFTVDRSIAPDEWRTKTVWISVRAAQDADAEYGQRVFANNSMSRDPNYQHLVLPNVIAVEADDEPACTLNLGDLWCGVVTLAKKTLPGGGSSSGFTGNLGGLFDDTGDQSFAYGTNTYTVTGVISEIGINATVLNFGLSSLLTDAERASLVLHVGSDSFAFSDANIYGLFYQWDRHVDWSSLDHVVLRLRFPSAPQG